jgi:hypothetical protein
MIVFFSSSLFLGCERLGISQTPARSYRRVQCERIETKLLYLSRGRARGRGSEPLCNVIRKVASEKRICLHLDVVCGSGAVNLDSPGGPTPAAVAKLFNCWGRKPASRLSLAYFCQFGPRNSVVRAQRGYSSREKRETLCTLHG